jgi:hypothetical protein
VPVQPSDKMLFEGCRVFQRIRAGGLFGDNRLADGDAVRQLYRAMIEAAEIVVDS